MTTRRILLAAGLAALGTWTVFAAPESPQAPAAGGQAVADFKLKDVYGKEFTLSEFKGRIVVLEWASQACPVSREAHQKAVMQNTYKKYADKGVIWLAIDSTDKADPEKNRIHAAVMALNYPLLHDPDGKVGRALGAKTTPHMFVIDKQGKVAYSGAIDDQKKTNYVAAALDDLLAGRPVATPKTQPYGCGVKYAKASEK